MKLQTLTVLAAAAVLAGCGGGSSYGGSSSSSSSNSSAKAPPASGASLQTTSTGLGTVLVDSSGRTLYMFGKDSGPKSSCSGACAAEWPPATASAKPTAGSGVTKAKLTVIKRSDGSSQLAYAGHPLYRFAADGAAGDTKGQGVNAFGGVWNVLAPSGSPVTKASGSSGGSSGGYRGY